MPVRKDDVGKLLQERVAQMRKTLLGHNEFLGNLFDEDDWSFVIKSHALIEAVVTQLISEHAGDARFLGLFERLPIADEETGKLAVAKHLNLLDAPQRRFIRFYSSLRNNLVHRVANVDFKFSKYIGGLDAVKRKSWQESIAWFAEDPEARGHWFNTAIDNPKLALWISVFLLCSLAEVTTMERRTHKQLNELALKTAEELFRELGSE